MSWTEKKKIIMAVKAKPTQQFVPIEEVRDGVVILKDGGLRAVLMVSSINLSLKSNDEQNAIIFAFQNFLNSLDFSTQILIQSRRRDIRPYLLLLENRMKEVVEPLIKVQIREYIEFIRSFTEQVNIMTKNFFVVVPYTPPIMDAKATIAKSLLGGGKKSSDKDSENVRFEEKRAQLDQRISVIQQGLGSMGIRSVQLGTQEVVELYYKTFNPGDTGQGIKLETSPEENKQ